MAPKAKRAGAKAKAVAAAGRGKCKGRADDGAAEGPPAARARKEPIVLDPPEVAPLRYDQRHPRPENALDMLSDRVPAVNAKFTQEFEKAMANVLDMYENVQVMPALTPDEGGLGATFSQTHFQTAMASANSYSFFGSLFLHDLRWRPLPGTPVNSRAVHDLVEAHYHCGSRGVPPRLSFEVVIVADKTNTNFMANFGSYHRISTMLSGCKRASVFFLPCG